MRLLLVRHGETPTNTQRLLDTRCPGPGLTGRGLEQAERAADELRDEPIGAVYASTFTRTQLTAAPLAQAHGLDVRVRDGLKEILAGELEMQGDDDAFARYLDVVMAWGSGDLARRMPGAETGVEFVQRFQAVVDEIEREEHGMAAIFSHGGSIRVWSTLRVDNLDPQFTSANKIPNGAVIELVGSSSSGWRALSWAGICFDEAGVLKGVDTELTPQPSASRLV